jgi:hypothetical protein
VCPGSAPMRQSGLFSRGRYLVHRRRLGGKMKQTSGPTKKPPPGAVLKDIQRMTPDSPMWINAVPPPLAALVEGSLGSNRIGP